MKQQLSNFLNSDKGKHVIYGTLIYFISARVIDILYALILTTLIAVGVEVYDKVSKKGTPEILDIVATVALPLLAFILEIIIN
jgi:hypothetical protein